MDILVYFLFAVIVILSVLSKSARLKGLVGEKSVAWRLNKLDATRYKSTHDMTIPSASGRTTQIDHLVFSKYGIFVIEAKNYTGWIVGKEQPNIGHKEILLYESDFSGGGIN